MGGFMVIIGKLGIVDVPFGKPPPEYLIFIEVVQFYKKRIGNDSNPFCLFIT